MSLEPGASGALLVPARLTRLPLTAAAVRLPGAAGSRLADGMTVHGSAPWLPSSALRYRVLPTADRLAGFEGPFGLIGTSVRLLSSYCHSCQPVPSKAVKYRVLPTAVSQEGLGGAAVPTLTSVRLRPS